MGKYALVIDNERCWGCKTCEVACKQENGKPNGVKLIRVKEDGFRAGGNGLDFVFEVNVCRHCEEPACVEACPEEAIVKREDGIVILHEERCSGCQLCIDACPYDAISLDPQSGVAQKCNLCYQRVDSGLLPACADNVCLAHCIYFGGPEEIREKIRKGI